jgi:hypothetical protein
MFHTVLFQTAVQDTPSQTDFDLRHFVLLEQVAGTVWLGPAGQVQNHAPTLAQRRIRIFKKGACWIDLPGLVEPAPSDGHQVL